MIIQNTVGTLFHTTERRKSSLESKIQVWIQWRTAALSTVPAALTEFWQDTNTTCLSFPCPSTNFVCPSKWLKTETVIAYEFYTSDMESLSFVEMGFSSRQTAQRSVLFQKCKCQEINLVKKEEALKVLAWNV